MEFSVLLFQLFYRLKMISKQKVKKKIFWKKKKEEVLFEVPEGGKKRSQAGEETGCGEEGGIPGRGNCWGQAIYTCRRARSLWPMDWTQGGCRVGTQIGVRSWKGSQASKVIIKALEFLLLGAEPQKVSSWELAWKGNHVVRKTWIGVRYGKSKWMDRLIGCGQKAAVKGPRDVPVWYLQLRL